MEKKAHGGFTITDKQGQVVIGKGDYDANGNFTKQEAANLSFSPSAAILDDMADKGLWGSYIFANNLTQQEVIQPDRTI